MGKSGIKWQAVTKAEAKKCVLLSSSLLSLPRSVRKESEN